MFGELSFCIVVWGMECMFWSCVCEKRMELVEVWGGRGRVGLV